MTHLAQLQKAKSVGGQHPAGRLGRLGRNMYELPIPDEYVDNVPDDDDLPALSYGVHRLRRIQIPGDIPGLPPAQSSDRGERARSGGHRTRVDPYGPQRHEGTSGSRPRPDEPTRVGAPGSTKSRRRRITQTAPVARDLDTAKAMDTVGQSREVVAVGNVVDVLVRDRQLVHVVDRQGLCT